MTFRPPPMYHLTRAAWIPTLVLWHATAASPALWARPCGDYAAALAASWRLRPAELPDQFCSAAG